MKTQTTAICKTIQRRLDREKSARKQAELLLESKSRELYYSTEELKKANLRLEKLAFSDSATGLPNRRVLENEVNAYLSHEQSNDQPAVLYIIELNDYNFVAGTLGHPACDTLLTQVGRRITEVVGETGFVSKIGSDKFAILQTEISWPDGVADTASRVVEALAKPYLIRERSIYCSASCGVASGHGNSEQAINRLFVHAETALRSALAHNRGSYVFFNKRMKSAGNLRLASREQIYASLVKKQYEIWLQPQVKLSDRSLCGYEALARWRHPTRGIVGPHEFISTIEHMGLALEFGHFILKDAFDMARRLKENDQIPPVRIGINLSAAQLVQPNLVDTVNSMMSEFGLSGQDIELEITEGSLINEPKKVSRHLDRLRDMDISIALDDFGTGYSSLSYLRTFPIDRLKVDRSFINELTCDVQAAGLANGIVQMAKALGMKVIAEGIESKEQELFLKLLGVDEGQGYLYSKPMSKKDVLAGGCSSGVHAITRSRACRG